MGYYNYHGKIKQKISEGKLSKFEFVEQWNSISPAMVLYFNDGEHFPIRRDYWDEYLLFIEANKNKY